ncbi:hypothetical protein SODG_003201 [Sodalis praecaptivus]
MSDGIPLFGSTLDFSQLEAMKIRAAQASSQGSRTQRARWRGCLWT